MAINELISFTKTLQKQGEITQSIGGQTCVALQKISEVLEGDSRQPSPDELAQDAFVEKLYARYLNKFPGKITPQSAKVYVNRVVKVSDNYIRFQKDPVNFKSTFEKGTLSKELTAVKKTKSKKTNHTDDEPIHETQTSTGDTYTTSYPLRQGFMLNLRLPHDLKMQEAAKFFCHLATLCSDFNPVQAQNFNPFRSWQQPNNPDQPSLGQGDDDLDS